MLVTIGGPRKNNSMGTFIVAAIAVPALVMALLHIRDLRHVAWLKTRMGIALVQLLTLMRTN